MKLARVLACCLLVHLTSTSDADEGPGNGTVQKNSSSNDLTVMAKEIPRASKMGTVGAPGIENQNGIDGLSGSSKPRNHSDSSFSGENEENETTAGIGRHALLARKIIFCSIIASGVLMLAVFGVAGVVKKNRVVKLGPVTLKRSDGCCCSMTCGTAESATGSSQPETAEQHLLEPGANAIAKDLEESDKEQQVEDIEAMKEWAAKQQAAHQEQLLCRKSILSLLFVLYVMASVGLPWLAHSTVSCSNGFFWETHMFFFMVFLVTKSAEICIYSNDNMIVGQLGLCQFLMKFCLSFLAYSDGYMDCTAVAIAMSCDDPFAQQLGRWMLWTYIVGVVLAQWSVLFVLALMDPSQACLMKLLHMDALAACMTLPEEYRRVWIAINVARTLLEDIPQAVLQTLFLLKVRENYFMTVSVCMGVASSVKAAWDASQRVLEAAGAYEAFQAAQEDDDSGGLQNVKCVVVGDRGSGKTSLLITYTTNAFPEDYVPTVFDNYSANVIVDGRPVTLSLWDTAGSEDYDRLRPLSYPQTDVFLFCFSRAKRSTFVNCKSKWAPEIKLHAPGVPLVLVGTDAPGDDRGDSQTVSEEELKAMCKDMGATSYAMVNMKAQAGVKEAFDLALRAALKKKKIPKVK